jgi:hypothetical protein
MITMSEAMIAIVAVRATVWPNVGRSSRSS